MDLKLRGRVALVGGSSSGLGFAIARALADEGCRVALNGRDADRLDRAVDELSDRTGEEVAGFRADVSVPDDARQLVEQVARRFGSVDILLCNAGGPPPTSFDDASEESWRAALDLNLLSTIHLCRAAVPLMRAHSWGRIICLASVAGIQPLPNLILSTVARAGVLGFAKALADEVADKGITVNSVCPGYMRTERVEELVQQQAAREQRDVEAVMSELLGDIPLARIGEPRELAAAVAFLASEHAGYITGAALQVDGGFIRSIL